MPIEELSKRFARTHEYMHRVNHPLTESTMPSGEDFFIVQPTDSRELSSGEFVRSIGTKNRSALLQLVTTLGEEFWASFGLGLLAVGTKTFTSRYWKGVSDDAERGSAQDLQPVLKRGGEDIDLVLLSNSLDAQAILKKPRIPRSSRPTWIDIINEKITAIGGNCKVKHKFEIGAFYYPFTVEIKGTDALLVDERAWRHKFRAEGTTIIVRIGDAAPIHLRHNFVATADEVVKIERKYCFCFSELFLDGKCEPFVKLLERENQQGALF